MDRIDLHIWLHMVDASRLVGGKREESSAAVAERVAGARRIQEQRFAGEGIFTNAEMDARDIKRYCPLDGACRDLLERLIVAMHLSARAYTRIIRIARTIADLEAVTGAKPSGASPVPGPIRPEHIAEASSFRFLDRQHPPEF